MDGTNEKGQLAIICQQDSLLLPNISQGDISLDEGSLCIEFSPQRSQDRWLRSTAVAALIWLAKMAETGAHWILQECSHLFPSKDTCGCTLRSKAGAHPCCRVLLWMLISRVYEELQRTLSSSTCYTHKIKP